MEMLDIRPAASKQEWFKTWFDTHYYHKLYSNHNDKQATDFIKALLLHLQPEEGSVMLDLGCGAGRHSRQLASYGYNVTGIDLSLASIREANRSSGKNVRFYRHDMRVPFGKNYFNYVFNFFTSFGYFKTQCEHDGVIHNMSEALKKGGTLVLDYMNINYIEQNLVPEEVKEIDGIIYHLKRWKDENYIYKNILIDDLGLGENFEFTEQVARFSLADFYNMCLINGLKIKEVFGDYQLNTFNRKTSPRLIIVAEKM